MGRASCANIEGHGECLTLANAMARADAAAARVAELETNVQGLDDALCNANRRWQEEGKQLDARIATLTAALAAARQEAERERVRADAAEAAVAAMEDNRDAALDFMAEQTPAAADRHFAACRVEVDALTKYRGTYPRKIAAHLGEEGR